MEWTIEQREQGGMKHIARMRKIQASGVRLMRHIGEEAAAQAECELTAALDEIERLKKVAELHNDSAVEAWHLTRKWQARCQELEQSAPPQMGELAVGGASSENQVRRLTESLAMMYDKWEDGTYLGSAFKLSMAEEQEILNLIVTKAEPHEQACANCGKPYRAHLLHDHNKCGPESDLCYVPAPPSGEQAAVNVGENGEPQKIPGKHRFIAGTCVDCGRPLDAVCSGQYAPVEVQDPKGEV